MDDDDLDWDARSLFIRATAHPALRRVHRILPLQQHAIARQVLATLARGSPAVDVAAHTLGLYVALGNVLMAPGRARETGLAPELVATGRRLAALLRPGQFFANAESEQYPSAVLGLDIEIGAADASQPDGDGEVLLPFVLVGWRDALDVAATAWRRLESPPGSGLFTLLSSELHPTTLARVRGSDRIAA